MEKDKGRLMGVKREQTGTNLRLLIISGSIMQDNVSEVFSVILIIK
jgi:hypothetical protein